jgi:hypothetical protein
MKYWTFRDYLSPAGNNSIKAWYEALDPDAQADFDTTLGNLAGVENWLFPPIAEFSRLRGKKFRQLGEIRWKTANVQHRVIGYAESGRVFVLLIGAYHKQRVYTPHSALDEAVRRRALLRLGRARTIEHE